MRAQDFGAAWRVSDAVLSARDPATRDDPHAPYHLRWVWDGTPPDGRDVVVRCYHGLGDTLQFARFLPALRRRAARVSVEAPEAVCALLATLPDIDRLIEFDQAHPAPPSPCDMEIMELGHVLRATPDQVARCARYLDIPGVSARTTQSAAEGALALCWQAGAWDPARSLPLPAILAACAGTGRRLVSLQRGPASTQATHAAFINPADQDASLCRTAALAKAATLVITVDTMVAHLAGALGCPTVLLLRRDADWRWPDRADIDSAWYPAFTILRQRQEGDWTEPLQQLARHLRNLEHVPAWIGSSAPVP